MSRMSFSPWNVIDLVGRLGLCLSSPVFFSACPWDIADVQGVADVFGWGDGSDLYFLKLIHWSERVVSKTVSRELHALG